MDKSIIRFHLRKNKRIFPLWFWRPSRRIYTCFPQGTALSLVKSKLGCAGSQLEPQARSWGCLSPWRGAALASNGKHISDWILSLVYPSTFKWDAHDHSGIPFFGLVSGMDIYLLRSDEVKARLRSLEKLLYRLQKLRVDDESTWMGNFSHIWINLMQFS